MKLTLALRRPVSQFVALGVFTLAPQLAASAVEPFQFNESQQFSKGLEEVAAVKEAQAAEDDAAEAKASAAESDISPIQDDEAKNLQSDAQPEAQSTDSQSTDEQSFETTDTTGPHFDEVELIRERYPDGKIRIERQVTLDAAGNYVNHGVWRLYSPTETVIAEGQYEMGKRVGAWTHWVNKADSPMFNEHPYNRFKAPFASQATFSQGVMDGEWIVSDADSRKMLQVSHCEGKRHGMVVTFLPNGKTYRQSSYDHGVPVGDVLEADAKSGELKRTATYIDGRRIITKTAHHSVRSKPQNKQPKKSEEMFLAATTVEKTPDNFWTVAIATYGSEGKDLRHGVSKLWFENGQVQVEGVYQHDKREGEFTFWFANGQVAATGKYQNDQPCDTWVWWHDNGQKAGVGKYAEGAMIGDWRWWEESGKLADRKTYDGTEQIAKTAPQDLIKVSKATPTRSSQSKTAQARTSQARPSQAQAKEATLPTTEIRLGRTPNTRGKTVK